MERLLKKIVEENSERVTGITLPQGGIGLHIYSGSHTAEGQLVVWEVE